MIAAGDSSQGPRLALRVDQAARALGYSRRHFERYVVPDLRVVYTGSVRTFPVRELEAWLERKAR